MDEPRGAALGGGRVGGAARSGGGEWAGLGGAWADPPADPAELSRTR